MLNEWYFSIHSNWVTAFDFDTDTDVEVYKSGEGAVPSKNSAERDVIDAQADESYPNQILRACRDRLIGILADDDVAEALRGPAPGDAGTE